jgi:hypothetical protein
MTEIAPRRAEQLQSKLDGFRKRDCPDEWACSPEPWETVARFASYLAQGNALSLKPWERAPCQSTHEGNDPAARLHQRMVKAGISPYHPDP